MALRPSTEALVTATGAYAFTSISVPFFTVTVSGGVVQQPGAVAHAHDLAVDTRFRNLDAVGLAGYVPSGVTCARAARENHQASA